MGFTGDISPLSLELFHPTTVFWAHLVVLFKDDFFGGIGAANLSHGSVFSSEKNGVRFEVEHSDTLMLSRLLRWTTEQIIILVG